MDKVQAIRHIRKDIFIELGVIDLVYRQIDDPDCISYHSLRVVGELLCHDQKRKMFVLLIIEKLNGVLIQQQGQRLDERDININQFFIEKVEIEFNQFIEKRMTQNIVSLRLLRNILQEDTGCLNQLDIDIPIVEVQDTNEMLHHVLLTKQIKV